MKTFNAAVRIMILVVLSDKQIRCQQNLWVQDNVAFEHDKQTCVDSLFKSGLDNRTVAVLIQDFNPAQPYNDIVCRHVAEVGSYRDCKEAAWWKKVVGAVPDLVPTPGAYARAFQYVCQNKDIDYSCVNLTALFTRAGDCSRQTEDTDYNSNVTVQDRVENYCREKNAGIPCLNSALQNCPERTRDVIHTYNDIIMPPACRHLNTTTSGPRNSASRRGSGSNVISVTSVLLVCALVMGFWVE